MKRKRPSGESESPYSGLPKRAESQREAAFEVLRKSESRYHELFEAESDF